MPSLPDWLNPDIQWKRLFSTVLALLPSLAFFIIEGHAYYLEEAFITVYLMIVVNRISLSPTLLLLHSSLIALSIQAFVSAEKISIVFIILCASYASIAVGLGRLGENWKTLATFTFIPSFYMGCALSSETPADYLPFVQHYPLAIIPPLCLVIVWRLYRQLIAYSHPQANSLIPWWHAFKIERPAESACLRDRDAAFIRAISVFIAASWVKLANIEPEKWVIWSSASVVTGERESSLKKHKDRFWGVIIGVLIGFSLAPVLDYGPVLYSLCILLIGISIDTVKNYPIANIMRGCLCVLAAASVQKGFGLGLMRVEDVIIGGLIGLITSLVWYFVAARR